MEVPKLPYNQQAQRVLELAKEEARAFNHNYIGTEHLLLGLFREESAAAELIQQGLTAQHIRGGIMFILGGRPQGNAGNEQDFTARTRLVLSMAGEEAQRLGQEAISPQDLFVALMREGQGIAAGLLQMSNVRLEQVGETARISIVPDAVEAPVTLPADLQEALEQHADVRIWFDRLSPSKQKLFVDHIEQAQDSTTRSQRVAVVIRQLERIQMFQQKRQEP